MTRSGINRPLAQYFTNCQLTRAVLIGILLLSLFELTKKWSGLSDTVRAYRQIGGKNPALYHRDIERLVSTILDEIGGALERGDRVELRGFGAFSVRHRKSRVGRNPRTGTSVQVSEKRVPFFKMGKGMRERLNR